MDKKEIQGELSFWDTCKIYPHQILASIIINLNFFAFGCSIASNSIVIERLKESETDINLTKVQESRLVLSTFFGTIFYIFIAGWINSKLGYRISALICSTFFIVGFLILSLSNNFYLFLVARCLFGMSFSIIRVTSPFIGEVSDPDIRGFTSSLWLFLYTLGCSMQSASGVFLPWRLAVGLSAIPPLICFTGFLFLHESPLFLMMKKDIVRAEESMRFYDIPEWEIQECVKATSESLRIAEEEETRRSAKISSSLWTRLSHYPKVMAQPTFWKPTLFVTVGTMACEWGSFPFLAYCLVTIFGMTNIQIDKFVCGMVVNFFRFLTAVIASGLVQKYPRRTMYINSALLVFFSLFAIGTFLYLQESKLLGEDTLVGFEWLPIPLIIMVYVGFSFGFGNVMFILCGEILPADYKSLSTSILTMCQIWSNVIFFEILPFLQEVFRLHGLFWMFSSVVGLMTVIAFVWMPETQGLSLIEIQEKYYSKKEKQNSFDEDLESDEIDAMTFNFSKSGQPQHQFIVYED